MYLPWLQTQTPFEQESQVLGHVTQNEPSNKNPAWQPVQMFWSQPEQPTGQQKLLIRTLGLLQDWQVKAPVQSENLELQPMH